MNQIHPIAVEGERLDRTERLIVALMGDLLRATPVTFDAVIDRVLAEIGQTCGFDRTYVILHRGGGVYDNTHEWCAAGIEPAKPLLQGAQIDLSPAWAADFDRDLPHFVPDVASLDADDPMTAFLQAQGIRSLMVVPLTDGQRYMGILGYDMVQTHRPMSEKERFLLASLARGVAAVIQRVETEAAMRRTQNALEDARSQMSATLAAIPDLILELDGDGRYTACHSSGVALLAPVDRIVGQLVEDVVPPDVASIARTIMREVDGTGRSGTYRYSLDIPGEGLRWYEVRGARRANQGGRDSYITIVRDITEREEAQAKATAREAMMRGLFEMSPLGIVLADPDTGRVVEANAAFLTQTGLNRGALRHVTMLDLVHPDFRDLAVQAADEVRDQGRFGPYETRYIRKDGSSFPAVVRGFMVQDPAGGRVVCRVIEDVAVARAQRAALEERTAEATEARRRLIAAVNALHDGFAIFDAEDRLLMSNARFVSIFAPAKVRVYPGVPYGALVQAGLTHGLFPAADGRESAFLEEMLHLKDGRRSEHDLDLSDGRTLRILSQPSPDGGRVELYVDVTALRRSEQHLENIVAGARVGTWEWDVETGENRINDRWAEMLGTTRAALGDLRIEVWRNLVHPDDMPRMQDTLQRVMGGELAQFDYTLRLRHADGRWVWVQSRGQVLARTPDGRPALMAGVHLDVTALRDTEARLEATIDGARVGTWEHEAATGMSFINDRWAQMLGYAAQDLQPVTAERFQALAHPDDFAVLTASEAASFARGDYSTEHEIRLRHRDGHWVWVLSRGRVRSFNADGTPAWLTGVHIDITARKELEMALQRERDTITRLMETSVSGIVAFDKDGRIIFANAAAEVAVGRDLRSLLGQAYDAADWGMTHLDGRPIARAERPIHRVLTGGETLRDFRFALTDTDGTRRVISLNAAALRGPGIDPAVVCTVSDITRMLEDEARLRAALERAEAGSRAKSQFLATMSHEIRTPLNGVLGTAELLAPLMVTDEKREMVTTIRKSGELLLTILNDILDLAKIESGRVDIERRPFRPADTLRDVVDLHWATADAKGVVLSLEVGAGVAAGGWAAAEPGREQPGQQCGQVYRKRGGDGGAGGDRGRAVDPGHRHGDRHDTRPAASGL
jgi:PAS domain S-box-containing protein